MENLFRDDTKKKLKRKKAAKATLSFAMDEEGEGEETLEVGDGRRSSSKDKDEDPLEGPPSKRSKFRKNPNVDTSFLPDREREEAERKERERLRVEWLDKQEDMKKEEIEVVYSYWDGSGHRKSVMVGCFLMLSYPFAHGLVQCKKGDDIGSFLEKCRQQFSELRGVSVDNLMYVKVCTTNIIQLLVLNKFHRRIL